MFIEPIARAENGFSSKFGVPRQSGLTDIETKIVFEPKYRVSEAVRGIEQFSHLWLIWGFSEGFASRSGEEKFSPTVRPPRLGGNERVGVFATRSPNRPNRLAISAVRLIKAENVTPRGPILTVAGADMTNGTPIYDIKPYIAYSDAILGAKCGFAEEHYHDRLSVEISSEISANIPEKIRREIIEIVANDPRPSYQSGEAREYNFEYCGFGFGFFASGDRAVITRLEDLNNPK